MHFSYFYMYVHHPRQISSLSWLKRYAMNDSKTCVKALNDCGDKELNPMYSCYYMPQKKRTKYNDKSLGSVKSKQDKMNKICSEVYKKKRSP